ncbi:MAG: hypothetical protein HY080_06875 [Gammaproteobacteria bacterium]|nr:hypothetical protein [Gammaproteobacteria bacterium]
MTGSLRILRENIYNVFRCKPPFLICDISAALQLGNAVKSINARESNFALLVAQNFSGTEILEDSPNTWPVEKRDKTIGAFKHLYKYAMMPYGSVIVSLILADNKKNITNENRFLIGIQDNDQARGGYNFILLPSDFPRRDTFPGSTQLIDPLAVLHHEFGHTKFDTRNKAPHLISLEDERNVLCTMKIP